MAAKRRALPAWVFPVMLASVGCEDGGAAGDSIPIEQLDQRGAASICAYAVRCGLFPDAASCAGTLFRRLQVLADVTAGKVLYDGNAAARCVDWYAARGCAVSEPEPPPSQSCDAVFTGTLPDGRACVADDQCRSDHCDASACSGADACCPGVCASALPVGGDCAKPGQICAVGAFCKFDLTGAVGTCTLRVAAGQPCTRSDLCVPGQFCDIAPLTGSGTCDRPPARGEACPAGSCGSLSDVCDPFTARCVARTAIGGACFTDRTCVPFAHCDTTSTMTCVARSAAGGACTADSDCLTGLPCQGGTCTAPVDIPACP